MRKIGLLFGSFNPVHNGHVLFAQSALAKTDCSEIWLIVQASNPYKQQADLASLADRVKMCELAFEGAANVKILSTNDVHVTTSTQYLQKANPTTEFVILLGQDVAASLPAWPDYKQIVADFTVYYHPRSGISLPASEHLIPIKAEELDISSSQVRQEIKNQQPIINSMPKEVADYIMQNNLYA